MNDWYEDARRTSEAAFRDALAQGATQGQAARIKQRIFGTLRGEAAAAGYVDAIVSEVAWKRRKQERMDKEAQAS